VPRKRLVSQIALTGTSPWCIDGVVSGLTLLWGGPGVGKSFTAISMAVSVATGRPWMGRRTKEGAVVYIAGEGGAEGVAHRVRAALAEWTITIDEDEHPAEVPFYVVTPGVDLVEGGGVIYDLVGEIPPEPISLIVVDTLSRCFVGDENKQEFMAKFVQSLDYLREHYNCSILIIHHANKKLELRGSSVLYGAVDVSWALTRNTGAKTEKGEKNLVLRADKLRERDIAAAGIKMRAVSTKMLGPHGRRVIDEFGDDQTTLIMKPMQEDLDLARKIRNAALEMIGTNRVFVTYREMRDAFKEYPKSKFDNALSFVVTFPGKWGLMRGELPGQYVKARAGIENYWSTLA